MELIVGDHIVGQAITNAGEALVNSDNPNEPLRFRNSKFDDTEDLREEIEERTRNGETCKQIAAALAAKGVNVSEKTISRRRVEWGLRKRVYKVGYTPVRSKDKPPRVRVPGEDVSLVGKQNSDYRKEEIHRLTIEGKTAEEIAAVLTEQGVELKSGASTIWRLQTYWKLIPYESDRANGRGKYARVSKTPKEPRLPKQARRKASKRADATLPADPTMHYSEHCSFGPLRRTGAEQYEAHNRTAHIASEAMQIDSELDEDSDADPGAYDMPDTYTPPSANSSMMPPRPTHPQRRPETSAAARPGTQKAHHPASRAMSTWKPPVQSARAPTISQSMDLMSAELLVDLATSSLAAANEHKSLLLAAQLQMPVPGSLGVLPPPAEDVAPARRKFIEAAKVAIDLALDPPS